jgi:anti-anti-sigma factor
MAIAHPKPDPLFGRFESSLRDGSEDFVELCLAGEVDRAEAVALRRSLERAAGRERHVLLDLRSCRFLDSSALAAILFAKRALDEKGLRLLAYGADGQVGRIFAISGLQERILGPERREEAIAELLASAARS